MWDLKIVNTERFLTLSVNTLLCFLLGLQLVCLENQHNNASVMIALTLERYCNYSGPSDDKDALRSHSWKKKKNKCFCLFSDECIFIPGFGMSMFSCKVSEISGQTLQSYSGAGPPMAQIHSRSLLGTAATSKQPYQNSVRFVPPDAKAERV